MKRLFGALSQCSTNTFTMMSSSCFFSLKTNMVLDEPQTIADAVFSLMITLSERASNPRLVVAPICQYLEESKFLFLCYRTLLVLLYFCYSHHTTQCHITTSSTIGTLSLVHIESAGSDCGCANFHTARWHTNHLS